MNSEKLIKRLLLIVPFICSFIMFENESPAKEITYQIKSNKSEFVEAEPIWIEQIFCADSEATGVSPISHPSLHPSSDLKFILVNPKNDTFKYDGGIGCGIFIEYKHDTIWNCYDLLNNYGVPQDNSYGLYIKFHYLPSDSYTLQGRLYINHSEVFSNKISFTVSKAHSEDSIAYLELYKIQSEFVDNDFAHLENAVGQFSDQFPNSVYLEKVRILLLSNSFKKLNSGDYFKKLCQDEIIRNPESYNNYFYLSALQSYFGDKIGFEHYTEDLRIDYKQTLLERIIKYNYR